MMMNATRLQRIPGTQTQGVKALWMRPLSTRSCVRPRAMAAMPFPNRAGWNKLHSVAAQATGDDNGSKPVSANRTPSKFVLDIWHKAEAVCFDVDCTITVNDTLDLLAEFMGVGEAVAELTSKAMDGTMNLEESLDERLKIINCKPTDIKKFLKAHPPESRLTKGIVSLVKSLHNRGISVYMITGGFREVCLPIAEHLGIPKDKVFANRMLWQWDDDTMEPTRLVGFDMSEPTARNQGKPQAIASIRQKYPYNAVVMIGDGITDLEAVQVTGGADLFIGYGGIVERPAVEAAADWFVTDYSDLEAALKRYQVAMIGSGAWASAAVRMVAQNTMEDPSDEFEEKIPMWVYEEDFEGRKLTEFINKEHQNPKYLPGVTLPDNVYAVPELTKVIENADIIIICAPHQFVRGLCKQMAGQIKPGAVAISLIKGMRVRNDGPQLISQMVTRYLGIDCSVLMGANLADGIAREELSEAVIGYNSMENARTFRKLFQRPYFKVNLLPDVAGAEMCGTLKNIVALAAGFVDGLGYGPNSKAAILREGLNEMMRFSQALYPTIRDDTFMESCGMADLVATCYGGRNRRVAMAYVEAWKAGKMESFDQLEVKLLNGQKLQGVQTSDEVQEILKARGWEQDYPLFTTINRIVQNSIEPNYVVNYVQGAAKVLPTTGEPEPAPVPEPASPKKPRFAPLTLTL